MNHAMIRVLAILGLMSYASPLLAQDGSDDGYRYRIGEVNPYNNNGFLRYYGGVQRESRASNLYRLSKALESQMRDDRNYLERLNRRYAENFGSWQVKSDEYSRQYEEYNKTLGGLKAVGQSDTLTDLKDYLESNGRSNELDLLKSFYDSDGDRMSSKLNREYDRLSDKADEMRTQRQELDSLGTDLNRFKNQINSYQQGAQRTMRGRSDINQALTNQLTNDIIQRARNNSSWNNRDQPPVGNHAPGGS